MTPVTFPPGRARLVTISERHRIGGVPDDWNGDGRLLELLHQPGREGEDHVGFRLDRFRDDLWIALRVALAGEAADLEILSLHVTEPSELEEKLAKERVGARLGHEREGSRRREHGDLVRFAPLPRTMRGLLGVCRRRLHESRAKPRDDLPPPHEHLPRKRTLLSPAVKHERARYAMGRISPSASSPSPPS